MVDFITQWDFSLLYLIQENLRTPFLDSIAVPFSNVFNGGILWFVLCAVLLLFRKTRSTGVLILFSMAVAYLTGEVALKNIICRLRPCNIDTSVILALKMPSSYSFPSGHTASSFAAATAIFAKNKKWGTVAICLGALVGFSRLYLFVHFPTDVLAGMVLGILSGVFAVFIFRKFSLEAKIDRLLSVKQ